MSVIDLISSDRPANLDHNVAMPSEEIVEILSSSPPRILNSPAALGTPRRHANSSILTSSPLFEFEKLRLERETQQAVSDTFVRDEQAPLAETPLVETNPNSTPSGPAKRQNSGAESSGLPVQEDPFQLTPSPQNSKHIPKRKKLEVDEQQRNQITEVNKAAHNETSDTIAARKETTEPIEAAKSSAKSSMKPRFKESSIVSAPRVSARRGGSKGEFSSSKVAAASKASDRKVAGENLVAHFHVDTSSWMEKIQQGFGTIDINVQCEASPAQPHSTMAVPDGITMLVTVQGNFDDVWDSDLQIFVKTEPHKELMDTAIVAVSASHLDDLGNLSVEERQAYFSEVKKFASAFIDGENKLQIIYFFPEVGAHFRKRVDKFSREMRRLVTSGESGSSCMNPPDEHFYTNLEAELQILSDIRAYYPKKCQDAAEMISNCIVDLGVSRYHLHMDETHDVAEAYVKSKTSVLDITIESLAKVQGLPPRIAAKLGSEMKNLGRIWETLGCNKDMRTSRIKRFGQGTWNSSLLSFLEDDDPDKII